MSDDFFRDCRWIALNRGYLICGGGRQIFFIVSNNKENDETVKRYAFLLWRI